MRLVNTIKNIVITVLITLIYAIWSADQLHELSGLHIWAILIVVGALILHLLVWIDREVIRINKERRAKRSDKISKDTAGTTGSKK